jgi:cytochrome P450
VRFPAGAEVAYSLHALHRHPEAYPAPHRFDPDRWLPARADHLSRHNFIPFSAGTHQCIGNNFAEIEMAIATATIAARWRLRPDPRHVVREVVGIFPNPNRMPMIVTPREG